MINEFLLPFMCIKKLLMVLVKCFFFLPLNRILTGERRRSCKKAFRLEGCQLCSFSRLGVSSFGVLEKFS